MDLVAQVFEAIGAAVLLGGLFPSVGLAVRSLPQSSQGSVAYRGPSPVLRWGDPGFEIILAADLVRTVAFAQTLQNVARSP